MLLTENVVHLWQFRLDRAADEILRLQETLATEEKARAARFVAERDRRRFTAGRGMLRAILSRYGDQDPSTICFAYGPQGKPALGEARGLEFNLAHSGETGLLGITRNRRIGVDLEEIRPMPDAAAIAARFFAPGEARAIADAPETLRIATFFAVWTRKEAYVKALGAGLSIPLDGFEVSADPHAPPTLISAAARSDEPHRWHFRDASTPGKLAATVAVEGSGWSLSTFADADLTPPFRGP